MIIVDMSSGNLCKNDKSIIKRMIDSLASIDKERKLILKFQLFQSAPPNIPLTHECFEYAYSYGRELGFEVTSSVFDMYSLEFLLEFEVPFIKLACRPELYWLIGEIPRKVDIIVSGYPDIMHENLNHIQCVSKYPATIEDYKSNFTEKELETGISDHCEDFQLYYDFEPNIYEAHFCLENSVNNPDANLFSRTPDKWKEFLDKV